MDLGGRCVLITGASSGIGRETAILLSELQARLVLVGRNTERLQATHQHLQGEGHRVEPFDLSALAEIPGWIKRLTAETGPLAGLVHSAGIQNSLPLRVLSPGKLEEVFRINVSAAVMLAKGFRQKGCCRPDSSIVFVSSSTGLAGRPGIAAYSASKGALNALARTLAMELAPERIRVNCVAPGLVRTEMLEQVRDWLPPEQFAALEAQHPLGLGTARDVAHAIAFLLADTARWVTGTTLVVDGGHTAH
jgi:NAD(P)-dependent dehydrogenase (short-subunit alcohol dehydrogenase family)